MYNPSYPRPQFVRRNWQTLEGPWLYSFSFKSDPGQVDWQGEICVPFPPESPLSGVEDPDFHPVIWYQRHFQVPDEWQEKRLWLHFGAVDYLAKVWVNGQLVAEHEGGFTPFSADITDVLVEGEQIITVQAVDEPTDLEIPRGKQDWELESHSIWYPRTTGIWQPVWLEPVPATRISELRLTPDIYSFSIGMEVEVDSGGQLPGDLSLEVQLSLDDNRLFSTNLSLESRKTVHPIQLPRPRSKRGRQALLWSPENPTLFDLVLTLRQGGQVIDQVESYAALRSVETCDGAFHLNGQPYFLQMVLDQGYWAESNMAAPNPDALRRDVELTKAMGFNGVRKHQKIEDPRYLYWADRLGLLVWGELPSAYKFSASAARHLVHELTAMIERDYNHPCLVAWVPFNESWGIADMRQSVPQRHLARSLYYLAKALDPTRLVIENDGWEHVATDLFTIHDYENKPEVFRKRYDASEGWKEMLNRGPVGPPLVLDGFAPDGLPVILSEFGGVRLGEGKGWGYLQAETPEEFLTLFAPLMKAAYGKALSGYCYTQLTDTFQEQNGLLYADRRPKIDPVIIARILKEGMKERLGLNREELSLAE